jgi:hypothetical protein
MQPKENPVQPKDATFRPLRTPIDKEFPKEIKLIVCDKGTK